MAVDFRDWLEGMQVNLHLTGCSQEAALQEASQLLRDHPGMIDFDKFHADLIARERLSSTASGSGIAFPHARTDAVKDIVIAAARSQEGVLFEGQGEPVHLLFIMGAPKDRIPDHLACVAWLARVLRKKELREKLLSANTAEEFIAELQDAL